jgi:hypothetical protein
MEGGSGLGLEIKEKLKISDLLPFAVSHSKVIKVSEDIGIKSFKFGPFRGITSFVEKWMNFLGFRSPFRPSLVRLYKKTGVSQRKSLSGYYPSQRLGSLQNQKKLTWCQYL